MSNATGGNPIFLARYDPFGGYRTPPGTTVNPDIIDRGFTGHVHDNTGAYPTEKRRADLHECAVLFAGGGAVY